MELARTLRAGLLLVLAGSCPVARAQQFALELGVEHFRWREFQEGARLLEETGPRYRVGGRLTAPLDGSGQDAFELRGGIYFGGIDYDGQACDQFLNCVPFETDADYRGAFFEGLFAHRFAPDSAFELFAGGGVDGWQREIQGRGSVLGVEEHWTAFYLLGGAGARWTRAAVQYRARAGLKYPFYTDESAEAFDVTLNPEGELSWFADLGAELLERGRARWGLGVYYDSFRFDASDPEPVVGTNLIVLQPESRQDTVGIYGLIYLR